VPRGATAAVFADEINPSVGTADRLGLRGSSSAVRSQTTVDDVTTVDAKR
jgi:hypothetical protein